MKFGCRLVGKVAADNSHKWVFRDSTTENDPTFISSWNVSIDAVRGFIYFFNFPIRPLFNTKSKFSLTKIVILFPVFIQQQPRAWEVQFNSGIQVSFSHYGNKMKN